MEHVNLITGIILPYFNFALFLGLCVYFFRKPLAAMALNRRKEFERAIQEATKVKDDALRKNQELTQRLRQLGAEVEAIKSGAAQAAEKDAQRMVADAETLARNLIEDARRMADAEVDRAKNALKVEIVNQVREAVVDKIKHEIKPADHAALIQKKVGNLGELTV